MNKKADKYWVPDELRNALAPLLVHKDKWLLHYPLYLNTFCFAHHVANCLSQNGTNEDVGANFVRHDWWRGHPTFTYHADIEIFVGIKPTVQRLRELGHSLPRECILPFTGYKLRDVFVRKDANPQGSKSVLIADVRDNAIEVVDEWKSNPPSWLGSRNVSEDGIRDFTKRSLGDLFSKDQKLYVFTAPTAYLLRSNKAKYICHNTDVAPIPTAYVLRCNSNPSKSIIDDIRSSISNYYRLLLDSGKTGSLIGDSLPDRYARLAMTCGQPNPFPEIYSEQKTTPSRRGTAHQSTSADLNARYARLLRRHHEKPRARDKW